jgi:hypothetical protein
MLKIEDTSTPPTEPSVNAAVPSEVETGKWATFAASSNDQNTAVLSYYWDFGDGTSREGASVTHAYTHPGEFKVRVSADNMDGVHAERSFDVTVRGKIDTRFDPSQIRRPVNFNSPDLTKQTERK